VAIGETVRGGHETTEVRYCIPSRRPSAKQFGAAVRSHRVIENRLHWQLDVAFGEDLRGVRKGRSDANLSSLRRKELSLLKNFRRSKVGIKNQRLTAAWNDDYLAEVSSGE
jgi:predicted transposase YbfD/YdcC